MANPKMNAQRKPPTKQEIVLMLGLSDRKALTKHTGGTFTFTARYEPTDAEGREGEISAALVSRAQGWGFTLRVRHVSRVLGAARGYAQRFTFDLVRNEGDRALHDVALVCVTRAGRGRAATAAVLSGAAARHRAGLVEARAGAESPGVEAVFSSLDNIPLPARVAVLTDGATAREIVEAQAGRGRESTRRRLDAEPRLTIEPVARAEVEAFAAYGGERLKGAALLRVYRVCREVAEAVEARGLLTAGDLSRLEGAHSLFYAAGAGN